LEAVFLHETQAAVLVFDLRGFSRLCAELSPLDLGLALGKFYLHVEQIVEKHGGRVVKLMGDAVLTAWLANETGFPRPAAMAAVQEDQRSKRAWLAAHPELDYGLAGASGPVLAGQIGTAHHSSFDVLGDPVNTAFKLTSVASARGVDHLMAMAVQGFEAVEVEGVELGGRRLRLFRLLGSGEAAVAT
jgi:adenylate cyclase